MIQVKKYTPNYLGRNIDHNYNKIPRNVIDKFLPILKNSRL